MLIIFMPGLGIRLFITRRFKLQIARSFLQLTALVSYVVGLIYTPISTAASIYFSGPLIVVALASPLLGESVGFRSTRIRTFEQTLIAIPNNRLAEFVIDNISSRPHRRVWLKVGLTFDTPSESMREAVMQIERLLRNHPDVSQESTLLVRFNEITDESLEIMVYYFTATTVWADYLRIREDINLRVIEVIESLGLRLAFPTRTVHVANGFLKGDEK